MHGHRLYCLKSSLHHEGVRRTNSSSASHWCFSDLWKLKAASRDVNTVPLLPSCEVNMTQNFFHISLTCSSPLTTQRICSVRGCLAMCGSARSMRHDESSKRKVAAHLVAGGLRIISDLSENKNQDRSTAWRRQRWKTIIVWMRLRQKH